jgi:hypothetical protein
MQSRTSSYRVIPGHVTWATKPVANHTAPIFRLAGSRTRLLLYLLFGWPATRIGAFHLLTLQNLGPLRKESNLHYCAPCVLPLHYTEDKFGGGPENRTLVVTIRARERRSPLLPPNY